MKIYRDLITDEELFSDSLPMKLVDDLYYEVEGKTVSVTESLDDSLFGGNASAEEPAEASADPSAETGINVVLYHKLASTSFGKKDYQAHIKGYMKAVKAKLTESNPGRVETFVKGMPSVIKKILGNFDNYAFYTGPAMNPEGMAILCDYREDGITPFFIFFKDGLVEEKC